jgi:hypothetical protein
MADLPSWVPLVAALVSGGAAGALINAYFAHRRNRIQPLQYREAVSHVFDGVLPSSSVKASITLTSSDGTKAEYNNLHLVNTEFINTGSLDLAPFIFNAAAAEGYEFVFVDAPKPDASHSVIISNPPSPATKKKDLEVKLSPLNRANKYQISFYLIADGPRPKSNLINYTSAQPVRLIKSGDAGDVFSKLEQSLLGNIMKTVTPKYFNLLKSIAE